VSIQWGRVLLAAFLMELVLFAIGPAALIGVKGTRMYVALTATQPEPWQYLLLEWSWRGVNPQQACPARTNHELAFTGYVARLSRQFGTTVLRSS
jgi:hypothetical protein